MHDVQAQDRMSPSRVVASAVARADDRDTGNSRRWLLILLTVLAAAPARAAVPTFDITPQTRLDAGFAVEWLHDKDHTLDPASLFGDTVQFEPPLGERTGFGRGIGTYWYRFALRNVTEAPLEAFIEMDEPHLDEVALHRLRPDGAVESSRTGDALPFAVRPLDYPTFVFPVRLEPGDRVVFLLEAGTSVVQTLPLTIAGDRAFVTMKRDEHFLRGFYFGWLLIITLSSAIGLIARRQQTEFWYAVQSVAIALFSADHLGLLYPLWPTAVAFNQASTPLFGALLILSSTLFSVSYLELAGRLRRLVVGIALGGVAGWAIGVITDPLWTYVLSAFLLPTLAALLLGCSIGRALRHDRQAQLFTLAWAPMFTIGTLYVVLRFAPLAPTEALAYGLGATILWERLVSGVALYLRARGAMQRELARRQEALRISEQNRRLEVERQRGRRLEGLGRLAGGIAHDFNNLLQAIGGYLHLVARHETLSPDGRHYVDEAQRSVTRAADLTRQLLVFGRSAPAAARSLAVDPVLASLDTLLSRLIPSNITLERHFDASEAFVRMDRAQLELAVTNLCLNARDAMPQGGHLRIASSCDSSRVRIAVEDDGAGIPQEDLDRVLEPFFTTKGAGEGTGLGLAMVHAAVTAGGGELHARSRVGVGSRFEIELPRAEPAGAPPEETGCAARGGTEHVLLADDAPRVREVASAILSDAGYRVTVARDGVEAMASIENGPPPDLVVLDLVMPRLGGRELYRRLRERQPGLPILLCTGYGPSAGDPNQQDVPAPILLKPYQPDELLRRVRALLDGTSDA